MELSDTGLPDSSGPRVGILLGIRTLKTPQYAD